ncbi:hypothetical protein [Spiroplasma endosymbiont of 'Nebria riversi']|uniref:hypothetical protein n=1 Tax=Spiroplasma endosymbiont of 'Nebria riversi' TaxID=2792084 RepID=UPI001C03B005|nr:hypothetical protein [Spiroplasma endosymbiont of 'Nebria riversi']
MAVEKLTVALAIIASGRKMVMICEAVSIQFSILMPAFWIAQPISLNVGIHRPEYLQFAGGIKSSHSLLFEPSGIKVVEFRTLKS